MNLSDKPIFQIDKKNLYFLLLSLYGMDANHVDDRQHWYTFLKMTEFFLKKEKVEKITFFCFLFIYINIGGFTRFHKKIRIDNIFNIIYILF